MTDPFLTFENRDHAGRQLAERMGPLSLEQPVVYALPRGGVPIGVAVAQHLNAPLDLLLVRKIGAPGNPEVALGAIVEGEPPETIINEDVMRISGADDEFLAQARVQKVAELDVRRAHYVGDRPRVNPRGRSAIVVDDGV